MTQVEPDTLKTLSEGLEAHHRNIKKHRRSVVRSRKSHTPSGSNGFVWANTTVANTAVVTFPSRSLCALLVVSAVVNHFAHFLQGSEVEPEPGLGNPGSDERAGPADGAGQRRGARRPRRRGWSPQPHHRHHQAAQNQGVDSGDDRLEPDDSSRVWIPAQISGSERRRRLRQS